MVREILRIEQAVTNSSFGKNPFQAKLNVFSGETVGIIGMNNAGKTELVQGICGAVPFESVRMYLEEKEIFISSIEMGRREGIYYFSSATSLIPEFSIWENFQLAPKDKKIILDNHATKEHCREMMEMLNLNVDIDDRVGLLNSKNKLMVEIAKALYSEARILIFDDIFNAFSDTVLNELEDLFKVFAQLHIGVLIVDNSISHLKRFCQRLFVMRTGRTVAILEKPEIDDNTVIAFMMGTSVPQKKEGYYEKTEVQSDIPLLEFRDIAIDAGLQQVSFQIFEKERVGILDLNGNSGELIWGILQGSIRDYTGCLCVQGNKVVFTSSECAVNFGIAVMKKSDPFFNSLSLEENILLPALKKESRAGGILKGKELKYRAHELMTDFIIGYRGLVLNEEDILHDRILRQKISLCRLLSTKPALVVLPNPTQGMDMELREVALDDIRKLKEQNTAVLIISSDINELVDSCERILFVNSGKVRFSVKNNEENRKLIFSRYRHYLKQV